MPEHQDRIVAALMERLIAHGPEQMGEVFAELFDLAMRLERERFLAAGLYERTAERRGYANGYKAKKLDTPAGTVAVEVPKTREPGLFTGRAEARLGHGIPPVTARACRCAGRLGPLPHE